MIRFLWVAFGLCLSALAVGLMLVLMIPGSLVLTAAWLKAKCVPPEPARPNRGGYYDHPEYRP